MSVFSETREKHVKDGVRISASEGLNVYPLLRHFCKTVVEKKASGRLDLEHQSFDWLCSVLDMLLAAKMQRCPNPRDITTAMERHVACFKAAYGEDECKPKHHLSFHVPQQFIRDGMLLDCWTGERHNKMIKAECQKMLNTQSFEKSVSQRVWNDKVRALNAVDWNSKLLGCTQACAQLATALGTSNCKVGRRLEWAGGAHSVNDVLFGPDFAIVVLTCASADNNLLIIGQRLERTVKVTPSASKWRSLPGIVALPLEDSRVGDIIAARYWSRCPDGQLLVLL